MKNLIADRFNTMQKSVLAQAAAEKEHCSDLIDLSIGDTDFTTDERIIHAAMADALAGHTHYAAPQGDPELIAEIQKYYQEEYSMQLEKREIFITTSSCFGMELSLMGILNPGDEVLLFGPYFSPYKEQVELAGGKAVEVPTFEKDGFAIDPVQLEKAVTAKTRAIILNNPCNPTGAAYDMKTYQGIAEIAQKYDLLLLADEIYTDYMYTMPFVPIRSLPGMKDRTITLNSFSKNYIMTGWRIGFIIAPPALISVLQQINENMVYSAPSVSQRAAIHALRLRKVIGSQYTDAYKKRVLYAAQRINRMDNFSVLPPKGTFYLFMNIQKTGMDSISFCQKAVKEAGVAMVPGIAFGQAGEGYVRIACTTSMEKLEKAFDRLEKMKF